MCGRYDRVSPTRKLRRVIYVGRGGAYICRPAGEIFWAPSPHVPTYVPYVCTYSTHAVLVAQQVHIMYGTYALLCEWPYLPEVPYLGYPTLTSTTLLVRHPCTYM